MLTTLCTWVYRLYSEWPPPPSSKAPALSTSHTDVSFFHHTKQNSSLENGAQCCNCGYRIYFRLIRPPRRTRLVVLLREEKTGAQQICPDFQKKQIIAHNHTLRQDLQSSFSPSPNSYYPSIFVRLHRVNTLKTDGSSAVVSRLPLSSGWCFWVGSRSEWGWRERTAEGRREPDPSEELRSQRPTTHRCVSPTSSARLR